MEASAWKSPRRIEEDVAAYRRKRFEDYMVMVDKGELPLAVACIALREEIAYSDLPLQRASQELRTDAA